MINFGYRKIFLIFILSLFLVSIFSANYVSATNNSDKNEVKSQNTHSVKKSVLVGAGTSASSGLLNSVLYSFFDLDPQTKQALSTSSSLFSGLGAGIGFFLGGPLGAAIGGGIGGAAGSVVALAKSSNKVIKTVPRKVSLDIDYVKVQNVYLNESLFKQEGSVKSHPRINFVFLQDKAFIKKTPNAVEKVYPIGFYNKNAKEVDYGILVVDYLFADVNKATTYTQGLFEKIRFDKLNDAREVAKVDNKIKEKITSELQKEGYKVKSTAGFSIIFRNVKDDKLAFAIPNVNCYRTDGVTGSTGEDAKPKIFFDWGQKVYDNLICSGDGKLDNAYYCDSTQISLEILKRLDMINNTLARLKFAGKTYDVPYTALPNPKLNVKIHGIMKANEISVVVENKTTSDLVKTVKVYLNDPLGKDYYAGAFSVKLTPGSSAAYVVKSWKSLKIPKSSYSLKFDFGDVNLYTKELNPFATTNVNTSDDLLKFASNDDYKILHFKAKMMADGFTDDFKADFRKYAESGFLKFSNNIKERIKELFGDKIEFLPKSKAIAPTGFVLSDAGIYNVDILVIYNNPDDDKRVFINNKLNSNVKKVIVYFDLVERTTNPFYYLPLDGKVGVENGRIERQGYGIDFTPESVSFNITDDATYVTDLESDSNPLYRLNVVSDQSMERLNRIAKGVVLELRPDGLYGDIVGKKMILSLSKPYPVAMYWKKTEEGPAYSFYEISVDSTPVNTGNSFLMWRQFCGANIKDFDDYNCEFFDGSAPVDHQSDIDVIATKADVPVARKTFAYGLYVDEGSIIRDGEHTLVKMRSIIYAPNNTNGVTIAAASQGDKVEFEGLKGNKRETAVLQSANNINITSLETLFNLISDGWLCVSGSKNSSAVSIWWNPAKVFDPDYTVKNLKP